MWLTMLNAISRSFHMSLVSMTYAVMTSTAFQSHDILTASMEPADLCSELHASMLMLS